MGDSATYKLHITSIILLILAIGLNFGAIFGHSWWKFEVSVGTVAIKQELGILRKCLTASGKNCQYREKLFKFDFLSENREIIPDIILVVFIIAVGLSLITCINTFLLFACYRKKRPWSAAIFATGVIAIFGVVCNFGGMIYAQIASNDKMDGYEVGWSLILGWLASAFQLLGFISICFLLCFPPSGQDGGKVTVRYDYPLYTQNSEEYKGYNQQFGTYQNGMQSNPSFKKKPYETRIIHQIENMGYDTNTR